MDIEELKTEFCKPGEERALLYYAMHDIDNFYALSGLKSTDFLHPQHSLLFILMATLVEKGAVSLDAPTIINKAQSEGILHNIGGYEYINTISSINISQGNLALVLAEVLEASAKFRLKYDLLSSIKLIDANAKEGKSSVELMGDVESRILELSTESQAIKEPIDLASDLEDYIEDRHVNAVSMVGISTGYDILDTQIDGLVPGTVTVIAARKKMGKSALLTNIAIHVAYNLNIPVLYIDTEMPYSQWRDRALACMTGVKERTIKHGGFDDTVNNRLLEAVKLAKKSNLFHEHMPGYSIEGLIPLYNKYRKKYNIGLAVFDYIKEPSNVSLDAQRHEYQVIGRVTDTIKEMSGVLNIPFLTACQLNRNGEVASSDRIEWFGDVIAFWMHRTDEELKAGGDACGKYKLHVKTTRRGGETPEAGIGYYFFKDTLTIHEVPIESQLIKYGSDVVNSTSDSDDLR